MTLSQPFERLALLKTYLNLTAYKQAREHCWDNKINNGLLSGIVSVAFLY